MSSQLGCQIHSNHELPYSSPNWFMSFYAWSYFIAEVYSFFNHLNFILRHLSFHKCKPWDSKLYHWGLWLHHFCVNDLSFVSLHAKWNPKFKTYNALTVNKLNVLAFTFELTKPLLWKYLEISFYFERSLWKCLSPRIFFP